MMLTRHFTVTREPDSQGLYTLTLRTGGNIPESEIELELRRIVFQHNDAYTPQGTLRSGLPQDELTRLHERGPVLFKVAAKFVDSPEQISHLGGMQVHVSKIGQVRGHP
jgi:hypothetical protein